MDLEKRKIYVQTHLKSHWVNMEMDPRVGAARRGAFFKRDSLYIYMGHVLEYILTAFVAFPYIFQLFLESYFGSRKKV